MANDVLTFLAAQQTAIAALVDGATTAFPRVHIAAAVNVSALLEAQRFPCVVLNDGGGDLDQHESVYWRRTFTATIVDVSNRDITGEKVTTRLLELGEILVDSLKYSTADSISLIGDSDIQAVTDETGDSIVAWKTYTFSYLLKRD